MIVLRNAVMWLLLSVGLLLVAGSLTVLNWRVYPDVHVSKQSGVQLLCVARYQRAHDVAQDQVILAWQAQDDTALQLAFTQLTVAVKDLSRIDKLCPP